MTKEKLLEEAKKRYPIGTEFVSACTRNGNVTHENHYYNEKHDAIYIDEGEYCLYYKGEWAEIVSKSDALLVNNLIEGEIYHADYDDLVFQYKSKSTGIGYYYKCQIFKGSRFDKNSSFGKGGVVENTLRLATPEEKQWLQACIKADKFISKEEALKLQFEVGKWYKIADDDYYGKFLRLGNHSSWYFIVSEYIIHDKYIKLTTSEYGFNEGYDWEEVDLSEIQKYLPDDHSDKIKHEFKKGDYIVTLKISQSGHFNCAKKNYCFKIRQNSKSIRPEIDLKGDTNNGHEIMSFDKKGWLTDWRYATPEEIAEYDRLGKPFNVTTLNKKSDKKAVHCKTEQELEFVKKLLNISYPSWGYNKENTCIYFNSRLHCSLEHSKESNDLIYSFEEWCNKFGHKPNFNKKQCIEEILEEAKRRFPIECKFKPVLSNGELSDTIYTQEEECYIYDSFGEKWIIGSANIRNTKGDWAELVSLPEVDIKNEEVLNLIKKRKPMSIDVGDQDPASKNLKLTKTKIKKI